jgi:hypothetical protein
VSTVTVTAGGIDYVYVTYYMGYICWDGYLGDERPYDPGDTGGGSTGGSTGGGTTTPPNNSCSRSACLEDCDAAYLEHAGVEVLGESTIYHFIDSECGTLCQELSRLQFEACQGDCITDCTAP